MDLLGCVFDVFPFLLVLYLSITKMLLMLKIIIVEIFSLKKSCIDYLEELRLGRFTMG